ncbi:MAG: methyltransferase domain-containing protein [Bacteroidetes bacterium]|nr:MAG: methyltransferase domain-containing protein [Bacteroidota bacterium]
MFDWQQFWDKQAKHKEELRQVARTLNNQLITEQQLAEHVQFMVDCLGLNGKQLLLDVCCGNGTFTRLLAAHAKKTIGLDFSEKLIEHARLKSSDLLFEQANAMKLFEWPHYESYFKRVDAVTICFSFQYFDTVEKGFMVISQLIPLLKHGGHILLTDVPDRSKFFNYYNTIPHVISLIKQMATGHNLMGKFWAEDELDFICNENGLSGRKISQPPHFPYAHYRMDYLITKP